MRLIDADLLKAYIVTACDGKISKRADILWDVINRIPTAYDVNKIVDELKDNAIEFETFGICSDYVELSHAIEIVKVGVVNDRGTV